MVPDLVGKLRAAGYEIAVQAGSGGGALLPDAAYETAGALVTEHPFDEADVVLSVQPLDASCLAPLPSGAATMRCTVPPSMCALGRFSRAESVIR